MSSELQQPLKLASRSWFMVVIILGFAPGIWKRDGLWRVMLKETRIGILKVKQDQWIFEVLILRHSHFWNCWKKTQLSAVEIWLNCGKYLMSQQLLYFGRCFFQPATIRVFPQLEVISWTNWRRRFVSRVADTLVSDEGLSRLNIVSFCIRIPQQTFCSELIESPLNLFKKAFGFFIHIHIHMILAKVCALHVWTYASVFGEGFFWCLMIWWLWQHDMQLLTFSSHEELGNHPIGRLPKCM